MTNSTLVADGVDTYPRLNKIQSCVLLDSVPLDKSGSAHNSKAKQMNDELSDLGKRPPIKGSAGVTYLETNRHRTNSRRKASEGKNNFLKTVSVGNQFAEPHNKKEENKEMM